MSKNWEYAKASSEIAELGGLEAFKKFHFNRGVVSSSKIWLPTTIVVGATTSLITLVLQKYKTAKEQKQLLEASAIEFEKTIKDRDKSNDLDQNEIDEEARQINE